MAERKAVIKNADMTEDMQQDAVDCASQALEKYNIEKVSNDKWINVTFIALVVMYYVYNIMRIILFCNEECNVMNECNEIYITISLCIINIYL